MTEAERYLEEKLHPRSPAPPPAAPPVASAGAPSAAAATPAPSGGPPGWFTCEGRLPRMAYFLRLLVVFPVALFGFGLTEAAPVVALPLIVVTFILLVPQSAKRLHDMNQSGWLQLLCVIPLVHLWILLAPGTEGPNRYGPKPA